MSEKVQEVSKSQQHPEHRFVIRGKLLSAQPLVNIKVLDQASGQAADVDVDIFYRFNNLSRTDDESETSYVLLVCTDEEVVEASITIPAANDRSNRTYDLDLDQRPRKVHPSTAKSTATQLTESEATQASPVKTRYGREKPTKNVEK